MSDTNRALTEKVDKLFEVLGIGSVGQTTAVGLLPVNSVVLTITNASPSFGTWVLLGSGPLLGGQIGTVYAWKRTA